MGNRRKGTRRSGPKKRRSRTGQASVGRQAPLAEVSWRARARRPLALVGFAGSVLVLVLNYIMELVPELRLLPGGHSELYFMVGVVTAFGCAWVAFDLGMTQGRRR